MLVLGIESSCDETAAALVEDGRVLRSNVIATSVAEQALYGGVVPEIASRRHIESISPTVQKALADAGVTLAELDAVAVTFAPGLIGAVLVGVNFAKGLAYSANKPLVPVHHLRGHIAALYLTHPELEPPFLCLVASGGHSHIVKVEDYTHFAVLGRTVDDAAGEAFDKAARVLGLPYPGGPRIDALAEEGDPHYLALPHPHPEGRYDYSFSGMKTAFLNAAHQMEQRGEALPKADMAASFRYAVCSALVEKAILAAKEMRAPALAMAGGVSANRLLRRMMQSACDEAGIPLYMPRISLCTDNAAMIGSAAYYRLLRGENAPLTLNATPSLRLV